MSAMKELVLEIIELYQDGLTPTEISTYLNFPLNQVEYAIETYGEELL